VTLLSTNTLLGDASNVEWAPTVDQVAAILRARTRGTASRDAATAGEQDTFTANTRPTANQVRELIGIAVGDLLSMMGGRSPCNQALQSSAQAACVYRAAQLVETSYYPEQTSGDDTAFAALQKMWDGSAKAVVAAVVDQCPLTVGGSDLDGLPIGRIPDAPLIGRRTIW
jgi:hypothetical protein